jgi:Sel1 repeat
MLESFINWLGLRESKQSHSSDSPHEFKFNEGKQWVSQRREVAERGNADAAFELAIFYQGKGNDEKAAQWYTLAAQQDHSSAQYKFGLLYRDGKGVEQNMFKAELWFREAANQGNIQAQYELADLYARGGGGINQNMNEAVFWFIKVANGEERQDYLSLVASFKIAQFFHEKDNSSDQDLSLALYWFQRASGEEWLIGDERDDISSEKAGDIVAKLTAQGIKPAEVNLQLTEKITFRPDREAKRQKEVEVVIVPSSPRKRTPSTQTGSTSLHVGYSPRMSFETSPPDALSQVKLRNAVSPTEIKQSKQSGP